MARLFLDGVNLGVAQILVNASLSQTATIRSAKPIRSPDVSRNRSAHTKSDYLTCREPQTNTGREEKVSS
jgi:hypothetical protein